MAIKLIGLSGYAGSGKDTVAEMLEGYQIKKFAGKLKKIAALMLNTPEPIFEMPEYKAEYLPDWGMTVREFLQKLGTDAVRDNLHTDAWVKALFADYHPARSRWVITDVRFPNEAAAIKDRGGVVVRINRGEAVNAHPSETALDDWEFDCIIDNTGTLEDLRKNVTEWLNGQK